MDVHLQSRDLSLTKGTPQYNGMVEDNIINHYDGHILSVKSQVNFWSVATRKNLTF